MHRKEEARNAQAHEAVPSDDEEGKGKLWEKLTHNPLSTCIAQLGINMTDTINSFEEIGWFDPEIDSGKA